MASRTALVFAASVLALGCFGRRGPTTAPMSHIISHAEWETQPRVGYAADATRRNLEAGDSLTFRDLVIAVVATDVDSASGSRNDVVNLRLMQNLLFGVAPHDPTTLTAVAIVMALVGVAACWLPALRAARIDPAIAIRRQ